MALMCYIRTYPDRVIFLVVLYLYNLHVEEITVTIFIARKFVCLHLAAIESGAGGPTVLHPLVTEDQPSLLSHVRIIINTSSF